MSDIYKTLGSLLQLERPLVVFDFETTSNKDPNFIVQIAATKLFPDGKVEYYERYVKPPQPVELGAEAVHGITNEMLEDKPTFEQLKDEVYDVFHDADLAGFNSATFDFNILCQEFARAGVKYPVLDDLRQLDAMRIYHKHYPRTLTTAFKAYTGAGMEGAHDAQADIDATARVLTCQILRERLDPTEIGSSLEEISTFTKGGKIDWAGKLKEEDGEVCFAFGKNDGLPVKSEPGYARWMLNNDFPEETKNIIRKILDNPA